MYYRTYGQKPCLFFWNFKQFSNLVVNTQYERTPHAMFIGSKQALFGANLTGKIPVGNYSFKILTSSIQY